MFRHYWRSRRELQDVWGITHPRTKRSLKVIEFTLLECERHQSSGFLLPTGRNRRSLCWALKILKQEEKSFTTGTEQKTGTSFLDPATNRQGVSVLFFSGLGEAGSASMSRYYYEFTQR